MLGMGLTSSILLDAFQSQFGLSKIKEGFPDDEVYSFISCPLDLFLQASRLLSPSTFKLGEMYLTAYLEHEPNSLGCLRVTRAVEHSATDASCRQQAMLVGYTPSNT